MGSQRRRPAGITALSLFFACGGVRILEMAGFRPEELETIERNNRRS